MSTIMESEDLQTLFQVLSKFMMPFSFASHKGQSGRIAIIGGSKEYTGAPYFAGISALKVGGDLSYIFSTNEAAQVIKTYSPELIVYPILDKLNASEEIVQHLPKVHSLVIGPGLGRDENLNAIIKTVICSAREKEIPIVLDADGLFFINNNLDLIKGYKYAFLTPNINEFKNLYSSLFKNAPIKNDVKEDEAITLVEKICKELGNVTIIRKGKTDIISNGNHSLVCKEANSPRRCGGQGDLLSGSLGTYAYWSKVATQTRSSFRVDYTLLAALGACMLTRRCNFLAFQKAGRSTITSDMIAEIKNAISNDLEKFLHSVSS